MNKKIIVIFATIIVISLMFFGFGWKLFGFTFCDNPEGVQVTYSLESDNEVLVTLSTTSSYLDFKGAKIKYEEGILYVGARYGISIFGSPNGVENIIAVVDNDFYKIVVRGAGEDREILID